MELIERARAAQSAAEMYAPGDDRAVTEALDLLEGALEALKTLRDYVQDAAEGTLTYEGSGEDLTEMAKEDLAVLNAILTKTQGEKVDVPVQD